MFVFQIYTPGAVELQIGRGVILEGNVIAGSERGGFRIDGQACGTTQPLWANNFVHSSKAYRIIE